MDFQKLPNNNYAVFINGLSLWLVVDREYKLAYEMMIQAEYCYLN